MPPPLRILLLSYEFRAATFSGNGVLSTSQHRALTEAGHAVLAIAAAPDDQPTASSSGDGIMYVPVPAAAWRALDSRAATDTYAAGAAARRTAVAAFAPTVVLAIDYHGAAAAAALDMGLPSLYFNFRVHSHTDPPLVPAEVAAVRGATRMAALCQADANALVELAKEAVAAPLILLPPLRADVATLPPPTTDRTRRRLLTCCVRLSPEKEAARFAEVCEALAARGAFCDGGLTPALVGDGPPAYAAAVRARVLAAAPHALIVDTFLTPAELAGRVLDQTVLNFHPPLDDAYGMTVVEAAARGVPSILHTARDGGGDDAPPTVGVAALLAPGRGEAFGVDVTRPAAVADAIVALLADGDRLAATAAAARLAALAHGEAAHAADLAAALQGVADSGRQLT